MPHSKSHQPNRREFLSKIAPTTTALCFGCTQGLALAKYTEDKHKFDQEVKREITNRNYIQQRHSKYIGILKHLEKEIGKETLLEMLKKASFVDNVDLGKRLSRRIKNLHTFAGPFRNDDANIQQTIVREVIEDNETAFEMKITECLTEQVFRKADALDLGYACVCIADFGLPVGIHPKLKLIRTITLMQGHDCCNHRYVWEE